MAIPVGEKAPSFELQDTKAEKITLESLLGSENLVLLFFPLAFSSVCTKELCSVRDNMKMYQSLNAKIAGISVDSFHTLREFKRSQNLNFTLLSDFNKEVSRKYDSLYEKFYGMEGVSKRAAYVIDRGGVIRYSEVLEDAGAMPDLDAMVAILEKHRE